MMPDAEVITILICFHFNSFRNFKYYYKPSHTTVLSRLCQDVLLCNEEGEIINFVLTKANVDERNENVIDSLTDKVSGKLYADKGYISQTLFGKLFNDGIHILTISLIE